MTECYIPVIEDFSAFANEVKEANFDVTLPLLLPTTPIGESSRSFGTQGINAEICGDNNILNVVKKQKMRK